jgi:hypothetical protein
MMAGYKLEQAAYSSFVAYIGQCAGKFWHKETGRTESTRQYV